MIKLDGIQILRGLAALGVALFHFHAVEGLYGPDQLTPAFFEYGRIGVDLFFVISGAIMMHVAGALPPGQVNSANFLLRRAARIYPPYWVVTAGLVAVWFVSGKTIFDGIIGETPDLPASFALWPTAREPALGVGWTLIHEMYFYLVFALLLLAPVRLRAWLMAAWAAMVVAVWLSGVRGLAPPLAVATSPLTLEFILGAAVMSLRPRVTPAARRYIAAAGALWLAAAILWIGLAPAPDAFDDPMRRAFAFGPAAALILLAVASAPPTQRWPAAGVALGDWSYALYLVHVPVYAILGAVWARFAGPGLADNIIALAAFVATAVAASAVFYRLIERPAQKLSHRFRIGPPRAAPATP
jgi:peptidoglycan/LPS O-acetylase OafA/YrhL